MAHDFVENGNIKTDRLHPVTKAKCTDDKGIMDYVEVSMSIYIV